MRENKVLHVYYGERLVGTLALTESKKSKDLNMLMNGRRTVFLSALFHFLWKRRFCSHKRLFSRVIRRVCRQLPDAWGQLLLDRMLKSMG